jgi:hypothetical protein
MKYSGSCQCGKVTFEVDTEIEQVIACNCSRCRRLGSLLAAAPKAKFMLKSGKDALTEFRFNKNAIHHYFCATCGIQPYAEGKGRDGSDMVMVNIRCLDGVDPESFKVMNFDGASM